VGNSFIFITWCLQVLVHPHACGELRLRARLEGIRARFIPTHVGNSLSNISGKFLSMVHPHACGELSKYLFFSQIVNGSSPRMWGTPQCSICHMVRRMVHPHACGELKPCASVFAINFGSSPRMWGTRQPPMLPRQSARFIPTHVGNSTSPASSSGTTSVHPHACGELGGTGVDSRALTGSSPRMWGTPLPTSP